MSQRGCPGPRVWRWICVTEILDLRSGLRRHEARDPWGLAARLGLSTVDALLDDGWEPMSIAEQVLSDAPSALVVPGQEQRPGEPTRAVRVIYLRRSYLRAELADIMRRPLPGRREEAKA